VPALNFAGLAGLQNGTRNPTESRNRLISPQSDGSIQLCTATASTVNNVNDEKVDEFAKIQLPENATKKGGSLTKRERQAEQIELYVEDSSESGLPPAISATLSPRDTIL